MCDGLIELLPAVRLRCRSRRRRHVTASGRLVERPQPSPTTLSRCRAEAN